MCLVYKDTCLTEFTIIYCTVYVLCRCLTHYEDHCFGGRYHKIDRVWGGASTISLNCSRTETQLVAGRQAEIERKRKGEGGGLHDFPLGGDLVSPPHTHNTATQCFQNWIQRGEQLTCYIFRLNTLYVLYTKLALYIKFSIGYINIVYSVLPWQMHGSGSVV